MSEPPVAQLSSDDTRIDLENLRCAHQALRSMTLRMHLLVLLGLLAATLFVPVITMTDATPARWTAPVAAWRLLGAAPADLGTVAAHPLALPAGLALIKVGLVLILLGVVAALLGTKALLRIPLSTRSALMSALTSFALVLGAGALIGGLSTLPSPIGLQLGVGVAFPVLTGVWLWHGAWSLRQLNWEWTTSG